MAPSPIHHTIGASLTTLFLSSTCHEDKPLAQLGPIDIQHSFLLTVLSKLGM